MGVTNTEFNHNAPTSERKPSESFRFTTVWRELIKLLHEQVVLKRRKYLTRTSCAVFSGANAVDVLYRHIQSNPDKFPEKEFARPNVARLCQRFLDLRVFFPAKEKSSLKLVFEDSHFVFYRFNPANDYIGGLSVPMRSLKRSNSETDLISIIPEQTKQHHLTKQLSSALIPITRLRKSIRRRSMQKEKLTTITEMDCQQSATTKKRLTKFNSNQEVSDSPKMPAKKSIRRSLQMKSPSAKVVHEVCPINQSNRRITRSNAFRFGSKQNRSETSFNLSALDHSDVSLLDQSICSIATTAGCGSENGVAKRFTTRSTIEKRKKIRSIATFNLSFAI